MFQDERRKFTPVFHQRFCVHVPSLTRTLSSVRSVSGGRTSVISDVRWGQQSLYPCSGDESSRPKGTYLDNRKTFGKRGVGSGVCRNPNTFFLPLQGPTSDRPVDLMPSPSPPSSARPSSRSRGCTEEGRRRRGEPQECPGREPRSLQRRRGRFPVSPGNLRRGRSGPTLQVLRRPMSPRPIGTGSQRQVLVVLVRVLPKSRYRRDPPSVRPMSPVQMPGTSGVSSFKTKPSGDQGPRVLGVDEGWSS